MQMTPIEWSETLLDSYSAYFDTQRCAPGGDFYATMAYHARDEKYVLTQSAKLWAAESHEYVYLISCDHLTLEAARTLTGRAMEAGMQLIHPHPEHMQSRITALFVCGSADADALRFIRRFSKSKAFRFSLHGWMQGRAVCLVCEEGRVYAGYHGRDVRKFIQKRLRAAKAAVN